MLAQFKENDVGIVEEMIKKLNRVRLKTVPPETRSVVAIIMDMIHCF